MAAMRRMRATGRGSTRSYNVGEEFYCSPERAARLVAEGAAGYADTPMPVPKPEAPEPKVPAPEPEAPKAPSLKKITKPAKAPITKDAALDGDDNE